MTSEGPLMPEDAEDLGTRGALQAAFDRVGKAWSRIDPGAWPALPKEDRLTQEIEDAHKAGDRSRAFGAIRSWESRWVSVADRIVNSDQRLERVTRNGKLIRKGSRRKTPGRGRRRGGRSR